MAPHPSPPRRVALRALAALLALLAGASPATAQALLHVAQDGSAPFQTLQAAVDAASPGDMVIVGPGFYEPVVVDKPLTLLGAEPGDEAGKLARRVRYLFASDLQELHLSGLSIDQLWLQRIGGRSVVDDCRIGFEGTMGPHVPFAPSFFAIDTEDLLVQRSVVQGHPGGVHGLIAVGEGRVHLVYTFAYGGSANGAGPDPHAGGHAVWVGGQVRAYLTQCFLQGGTGLDGQGAPPRGGAAVRLTEAAQAHLTGYKNLVLGGLPKPGPGLPDVALRCPDNGAAQATYAPTQVVFGGAQACFLPAGPLIPFVVPEPVPGGRRVLLYGELGSAAAVLLSLGPQALPVPGLDGLLWVAPLALLDSAALVAVGFDTPAAAVWSVPPGLGLHGLKIHGQGLVAGPNGLHGTNAFAFVLVD